MFKTSLPPEEVAAIFVEPIQGESGYVVPPSNFLRELRLLCDEHGILLVADEVQSGVGRTGKWWAIEHSGVQPDIVCIAKGIASGMPLSVCMARAEIMDWALGSHGSTFGGNPVSIAAALATLDIVEREGMANATRVGNQMLERMRTWPARFPFVGEVRGIGLMLGIEFVENAVTRKPDPECRDKVVQAAFHKGVLLLGCGYNSIRLSPPLTVSSEEASIAIGLIEECFASVTV